MFTMKKYQETISLMFYKHGLACSTYPLAYIFGVIVAFLVLCYPLRNMPFHGNAPLKFSTPIAGYEVPSVQVDLENPELLDPLVPSWYFDKPISYVQQVVVKAAPHPSLSVQEGIKSSLEPMFDLLEHVDAFRFQDENATISMTDLCLRVAEATPVNGMETLLPQYNCLFLSPARFWHQDKSEFLQDDDLVSTIFGSNTEHFSAVRELLFGVPGVSKKNFLKINRNPLFFAFTFALKTYNPRFIKALQEHLANLYPAKNAPKPGKDSDDSSSSLSSSSLQQRVDHLVHIHYENKNNLFVEYTPLIFLYLVICLYLYFSIRKIEMVKSKWGLALSAMMTLIASVVMSLSLCVFVGLTLNLNGSEIFPYLVIVIGLENIVVITKSVVSTPVHLDVKLRIALGLQKEGWSMFKNLLVGLLICSIGFLTFVPAIQEFCLFAILGLGSDFFLQMFFFTTVLSIDIRRMELTDLQSSRTARHDSMIKNAPTSRSMSFFNPATQPSPSPSSSSSFYDGRDDDFSMEGEEKIPKRVRLMNVWARYRFLQRAIMVFVLLWVALVVCKTTIFDEEVVSNLTDFESNSTSELAKFFRTFNNTLLLGDKKFFVDLISRPSSTSAPDDLELWKQLPFNHWKNIFDFYNISLVGRYLTILPSIYLTLGHLDDQDIPSSEFAYLQQKFWKKLQNYSSVSMWHNQTSISFVNKLVRYPRSRAEFVLTILLGIFSFVLLSCCLFILYKCSCSRKYAEWRSSWGRRSHRHGDRHRRGMYYEQIRESTPLVLVGHGQEVECVCMEGRLLASSCLGGEVRIWDSETGECISVIDRQRRVQFRPEMAVRVRTSSSSSSHQVHGRKLSNRSSASSIDCLDVEFFSEKKPTRKSSTKLDSTLASIIPDLTETIDTDFRNRARSKEVEEGGTSSNNTISSPTTGFDFTQFQTYFDEQKRLNEEKERLREMRRKREEEEMKRREIMAEENQPAEEDDEFVAGSAIWCLAFRNNLAVLGCGSGDIEFWDVQSRSLVSCCQQNKSGVTAICLVGNRIIASRVDGTLDFFMLQQNTQHCGNQDNSQHGIEQRLQCMHLWSTRAHQMTINCLETDGVRILTASQDHMIKVHRIEDHACLYTLIGHTGCVTTLHVDKVGGLVVSGSSDCSLRLWEVRTGSCLHKLVGHQSTITCVAYDDDIKRLVSVAMDDRLCIWDASRGHLLHCVQMEAGCCNAVSVLNHQLILTGGLGCIYLWDVETCTVVRSLNLGDGNSSDFVRQLLVSGGGLVVADYGTQLRVIRFNSVLEKHD